MVCGGVLCVLFYYETNEAVTDALTEAAPILRRRAENGGLIGSGRVWIGSGLGLGTSCTLPCAFCPVATPYTRPPASGSLVRDIEPKSCSI